MTKQILLTLLLFTALRSSAFGTTLFSSNFDSLTVGSAISGFTPSATAWTVTTTGNVSTPNAYGDPTFAVGDANLYTAGGMTADVIVTMSQVVHGATSGNGNAMGIYLRSTPTQFYLLVPNWNTGVMTTYSAGGPSGFGVIHTDSFTGTGTPYADNNKVFFKVEALGTTLRWKSWLAGSSEPGSWTVSFTSTEVTAPGYHGFRNHNFGSGGGTNGAVDDVLIEVTSTMSCNDTTLETGLTGYPLGLTGLGTSWTPGTPGSPTFTIAGGTGASITARTVASATAATLTINTGSATGTLTFTDPVTGNTCGVTLVSPLNRIFPTDSNIVYSGTWAVSGSGLAARAKTINAGSSFEFAFTGASAVLGFSETGLISGAYPEVEYIVDGGPPVRTALATGAGMSINVSFPVASQTTHRIQVWAAGINEGVSPASSIWTNQSNALILKEIILAPGATTVAFPVNPNTGICLGDSIVASVRQLGTSGQQNVMDGRNSWCSQVLRHLGLRPRIAGFGGTGLTVSGSGGVPASNSSFGLAFQGTAWSDTTEPKIVIVAAGSNDGAASGATFRAAYATYLATIRAAWPNARIFCLGQPSPQVHAADIATVVTASDPKIFYLNLTGLTLTHPDGTHLDTGGANTMAAATAKAIQDNLTAAGVVLGVTGDRPQLFQ